MNSNREYIRKYLKKNKRQKHNKDRNTLIIGQNNKLFILYFNLVNFNIYLYRYHFKRTIYYINNNHIVDYLY